MTTLGAPAAALDGWGFPAIAQLSRRPFGRPRKLRRLGVAIHGEAAHEEPDAICPRLRRSIRQRLVAIEAPDDWPVELALLPPAFPFQGDVGPCDRERRAVP